MPNVSLYQNGTHFAWHGLMRKRCVVSTFFDTTKIWPALTLIGVAGAHADVAHMSSLHHIVKGLHLRRRFNTHPVIISETERAHRLFDRGVVVEAMTCATGLP